MAGAGSSLVAIVATLEDIELANLRALTSTPTISIVDARDGPVDHGSRVGTPQPPLPANELNLLPAVTAEPAGSVVSRGLRTKTIAVYGLWIGVGSLALAILFGLLPIPMSLQGLWMSKQSNDIALKSYELSFRGHCLDHEVTHLLLLYLYRPYDLGIRKIANPKHVNKSWLKTYRTCLPPLSPND